LSDALAIADIAAVVLRLPSAEEPQQIEHVKSVAPSVQDKGAALLLDGHAPLVARAGADGAHLNGIEALTAAISILKPDYIAGCGGLASRHEAMVAGEAGADYLMFGDMGIAGRRKSDDVAERVAWWAELFEVPCMGFAGSLDEVEALAAAGADFVTLGDWAFSDRGGLPAAVAEAARLLETAEAAA
jgi:thiamine-phosphate pyrophosphorylase